ncbi:MAG: cation diffusion facilitator family transporter [Gammaproteobacteria bacterium]|nr:cation diffusion facilitator family transporter [Gammaproteobacteria bacterium]MCW9005587.1 cation diffusion facilitator family transporter [Gammaproteobacteria bacterium]MCW9056965.1 cation diffusion facilitator family transporter [Gammaproteobacteria bacterium]
MDISLEQRKKAMDKATWWGIIVNLVLAIGKLIIGFLGHSQALVADGLHSLSDLISDGLVLLATHHASADADEDHPYGHARYETVATIALGVLLIAVGIGISIDAIHRIINPEHLLIPSTLTLWIAGLSIVSKEALYQYTAFIARKIKSKLLHANAWHHRTDAISSIVVFIGITGAILGWPMLDSIAAVVVAVMIIYIGWELSHHSIKELVDTALDPDTVDAIKEHILNVDGVLECHMLRTRRMSHNALVDVHILVDSKLSVSEGHQISEAVEYSLISNFDDINDVTVHIDPEDDENSPNSCKDLPLRTEIIHQLKQLWADIPETDQITEITLHYLDGKVNIDIQLPISVLTSIESAEELQAKISSASDSYEYIRHINICFTQ